MYSMTVSGLVRAPLDPVVEVIEFESDDAALRAPMALANLAAYVEQEGR